MTAAVALIERGIEGRAVAGENERTEGSEGFEAGGDFLLGVFAGGVEGSGIGVSEGGEVNVAQGLRTGMHVFERVSATKAFDVAMALMVAGNHKNLASAAAKNLTGLVETASQGDEIADGKIIVSLLVHQTVESVEV